MQFELATDDGIDETTEPVAPGTSCCQPPYLPELGTSMCPPQN